MARAFVHVMTNLILKHDSGSLGVHYVVSSRVPFYRCVAHHTYKEKDIRYLEMFPLFVLYFMPESVVTMKLL